MPHPKDNELLPLGTTVIIKEGFNKGKKAVIRDYTFLNEGRNFLHYLGEVEQREGLYVLYHTRIEPISDKNVNT